MSRIRARPSRPNPHSDRGLRWTGEEEKNAPGQEHRILLRVREKAKREREEIAKKLALDKEQHLQEKKKRLNREKKLKRRQKETREESRVADDES